MISVNDAQSWRLETAMRLKNIVGDFVEATFVSGSNTLSSLS